VIRVTPITANAQVIFDAVLVGEAAAADQGCGYADEGIGMFGLALVAAVQAPASSEPGDRPLNNPAVSTKTLRGLDALEGNAMTDAPLAKPSAQVVVVVALVGMELGRTSAPRPTPGADGRDPAHQRLQAETVVRVGTGTTQRQRQWQSVPVRDQVDFRSALAAVGRIRSSQWPSFAARTLTESMAHRDQSSSPTIISVASAGG
jgi:hypothetical protein